MDLEKLNENINKRIKIITITIYIISLLIYELGICNGQALKNHFYNFSLCRIVLYIIFFILLIKNIDKFLPNAIQTLHTKSKKIIIGIYIPIMIIYIIYAIIKWSSICKSLTLIIVLLMGLLFIIYISSSYIKNVIILISTLGIVFTFATDFNHVIDEKKHIMTAINIANGNLNYSKNPLKEPVINDIISGCDIDFFVQFFNQKYKPNLTNEWNVTEETKLYYATSSPANNNFILYIPAVLGIIFAKFLGGSVADIYIIGRLFNLIAYGAMLVIILKLLPNKQKIFYIIYTLPYIILLSASFSVDGICIGILGIFIAYCLKLSEKDYREIKMKQILILMILFAFCLLAKNLAYCAIISFIFVLPVFKIIKNNKENMPILVTIIIISVIICAFLLIQKLNSTIDSGGDIRGGETSVSGQINFLLSSPINIIKIGFSHVMNSLLNYNWYHYLNENLFFGRYNQQIFLLQFIFVLYVCFTDNSIKIKKRTAIVSIITFVLVYSSTSLMLFLAYTPVGEINISGYQPRYIIPILPIILMLINNKKFILKNQNEEGNNIFISLISGIFMIIDLICLTYVI